MEENKYNELNDKMFNEDDDQVLVGSASDVKFPNPVKLVDHTNRYSVLRAYNSQASDEFIQKEFGYIA